jgi:hypothetical protein
MPIDKAPIDTAAMLIITDGGAPCAALNRSCRSRWSPPHDFRSRLKSAWARQLGQRMDATVTRYVSIGQSMAG